MAEVVIHRNRRRTLVSRSGLLSWPTNRHDTYNDRAHSEPTGPVAIRIDEDGQTSQGEHAVSSSPASNWLTPGHHRHRRPGLTKKKACTYTRLNHVITSDLDDFLGLSIDRVAKGLEQRSNGDIDRSYKATANGSTVTVSNERPFTVIDDRPADADPASPRPEPNHQLRHQCLRARVHQPHIAAGRRCAGRNPTP